MADVVVTGGGMGGLVTAMLLAKDGHVVTVLERDPAPAPETPDEAWGDWERKGVNQFRMIHLFLPRFRMLVERDLPEVAAGLDAAGALRFNFVADAPDELTGGPRPDDGQFEMLTGRRPVVEAVVAKAAEATPGITVRRGSAVAGLLQGPDAAPGTPHVVGVVTEDGAELRADLVVDTTGRRSPLPRWLEGVGARRPEEELEDSGFVYFGRYFRSVDGSVPPGLGPLLMHHGSISTLTLPADNGTWGVGIIASAGDAPMRALRHEDRWEAVMKSLPLQAHWVDGEPLSDGVDVMAKIEDRWRSFSVDGSPVVTGVLAVGDSWACTNPSVGRGASLATMHAVELRDLLREQGLDDHVTLAARWHDITEATVGPWYRETLQGDRFRLAEIEALNRGEAYDPGDPAYELTKAMEVASGQDGDVLRAFARIAGVIERAEKVFADPALVEKVVALGADWRDAPPLGPSRSQLLELVA
jgi:2-polyprenyl-6-methoxyphenol hydroxylase-like FAD-dependent oxidoreductase